jgi:hypothetical protein
VPFIVLLPQRPPAAVGQPHFPCFHSPTVHLRQSVSLRGIQRGVLRGRRAGRTGDVIPIFGRTLGRTSGVFPGVRAFRLWCWGVGVVCRGVHLGSWVAGCPCGDGSEARLDGGERVWLRRELRRDRGNRPLDRVRCSRFGFGEHSSASTVRFGLARSLQLRRGRRQRLLRDAREPLVPRPRSLTIRRARSTRHWHIRVGPLPCLQLAGGSRSSGLSAWGAWVPRSVRPTGRSEGARGSSGEVFGMLYVWSGLVRFSGPVDPSDGGGSVVG